MQICDDCVESAAKKEKMVGELSRARLLLCLGTRQVGEGIVGVMDKLIDLGISEGAGEGKSDTSGPGGH